MNQVMLNDLTFEKSTIIERLGVNRTKHLERFEKAWSSYTKKQIETLEKTIEELRNLKPGNAGLQDRILLPVPDDHTEDYDLAIEMLNLATNAEVTMSAQQYERFMLDRWDWKHQFETTNAFYERH